MNAPTANSSAGNLRWLRRLAVLPLVLIPLALGALLASGLHVEAQKARMAQRLSAERQIIEAVTSVRRDARKTYVALLERWLAPPEDWQRLKSDVVAQQAALTSSLRRFNQEIDPGANEKQRRAELTSDLAAFSTLVEQILASSDGPERRPKARQRLDEIDRHCSETLKVNVDGADQDDADGNALDRKQGRIEIAFVIVAAVLVLYVAAWYLRRAAARRIEEASRRQLEQEQQSRLLEHLVHARTSELEESHRQLGDNMVQLSDAKQELERRVQELAMMQSQLVQVEKLQAVGQLAAGIAHEINTPVQYVGDNINFLAGTFGPLLDLVGRYRNAFATLTAVPEGARLAGELTEAEEAADLAYIAENAPGAFEQATEGLARISTIVGAMKDFAHPGTREKATADLNRALRTTIIVANNECKYVADMETDLGDLPPVMCHLDDLNQLFLNLIINAAHAIRDTVGDTGARGRIRISSRHEGDSVRIDVADTGSGIPEPIRHRVFEPFFTTKPVGSGSGQGLAIAHSIVVDKHGGTLTLESEVGKGTTFTILLPV